ncbi:MAG: prenyltransferase, partial [Deltaproteobacteria bacterium]|nr:prenyltransferase [Deltaproteobacteria bacterium]
MSDTQEPRKDDLALDEPVLKDENRSPESLGKTEPGSNGSGHEEKPASTEKPAQSPTDLAAPKPKDGDEVDNPGEGSQNGPLPEAAAPKCRFSLRAWLQASRPTFFVATLVPLFLGYYAAIGYRGVQGGTVKFALILIASFLVHLATNLANDLFDHSQGVDTDETIGGSRVIQEGRISPGQIKIAIGLCYLVAFVLAIIIVKTDWILWCLVLFAAFSSFFYVCPPIKYGHRGLGEVFVFINMGLIMTVGTYMAITGHFDLKLISLALPVSLGVAGILYFQSLPEIETDAKAGKKTLAVKLGKDRAILAQSLWWPLIWVLMANLYFSELVEWPALLCLVT